MTPAAGAAGRSRWLPAGACWAVAVGTPAVVAAAGDSAAVVGLGPRTWHPPWDAGLGWSSALVTALLAAAAVAGATALWLSFRLVTAGVALPPAAIAVAALVAVAGLLTVSPLGSADHLSYLAYGRIAAAGADPYTLPPAQWHGGNDPVAGAVQPPWQDTPSVYGPVATGVQAAVAEAGRGSLRATVALWQLLTGACFLLTGLLLDRLSRHDPLARTRAAVWWTLNPLLLWHLVLGSHLDTLAIAAALAALCCTVTAPLLSGVLLGLAVGMKLPYALFGLAMVWGLRLLPRRWFVTHSALVAAGALLVLVPTHLWSGVHTYDQLRRASRFVSFASPWRPLVDRLDPLFGAEAVRPYVGPAAAALAIVVAVALWHRVAGTAVVPRRPVTADTARAALLLALAWVLTSPYTLPWYDAMIWAPLALLAPAAAVRWLDAAGLTRLAVLTLAYVPGRVTGLSEAVEDLTLGFRRSVACWLELGVLVAVVAWGRRRPAPEPVVEPSPAPAPAR